ncbi:MAG: glycosyltransferase [Planctomycetota bacterium]|nr:glycosyltransferase [Planctomycetota bacterium]
MRLLVLTAAYPSPAEPQRAVFIEDLNRALLDVGGDRFEIDVVAPRVHRQDPLVEERHGVRVHRFRYPSGGRRLKEIPRPSWGLLGAYFASGLLRALTVGSRRRCQLVVGHWVLPTGVIASAAARVLRLPAVLYAHGSDLNDYGRRRSGRWLTSWSVARASKVLAVSRELARILRDEHGAGRHQVEVLPMGVAPVFGTPVFEGNGRLAARRSLGLGDFLELLFVGDLIVEKGLRDLLAALRILWRDGVRARLHVAGDGPLSRELRGAPDGSLPAEALHLLGRVSPEELARWYRGVDLYVHPSHAEGTPLAVMEALASALPVVATEVGGVPDLVHDGFTGCLVSPRDPSALASKIRELDAERERLEGMRRSLEESVGCHRVEERARLLHPLLVEAAGGGV